MTEIRCVNCNKLLGKVMKSMEGEVEIKCSKCKQKHIYKIEALEAQS